MIPNKWTMNDNYLIVNCLFRHMSLYCTSYYLVSFLHYLDDILCLFYSPYTFESMLQNCVVYCRAARLCCKDYGCTQEYEDTGLVKSECPDKIKPKFSLYTRANENRSHEIHRNKIPYVYSSRWVWMLLNIQIVESIIISESWYAKSNPTKDNIPTSKTTQPIWILHHKTSQYKIANRPHIHSNFYACINLNNIPQ